MIKYVMHKYSKTIKGSLSTHQIIGSIVCHTFGLRHFDKPIPQLNTEKANLSRKVPIKSTKSMKEYLRCFQILLKNISM